MNWPGRLHPLQQERSLLSAVTRVGDSTITTIAGQPVQSIDDISETLANLKPGEKVALGIRTPQGNAETVTVTLGQYPGS